MLGQKGEEYGFQTLASAARAMAAWLGGTGSPQGLPPYIRETDEPQELGKIASAMGHYRKPSVVHPLSNQSDEAVKLFYT